MNTPVADRMREDAIAFRKRIKELILEETSDLQRPPQFVLGKNREPQFNLGKSHGGFLPLLLPAITAVASALPSIVEAGKAVFGKGKGGKDVKGSGKHNPKAKTKRPNEHAKLVKHLMDSAKREGKHLSLGEASKMAKEMRHSK